MNNEILMDILSGDRNKRINKKFHQQFETGKDIDLFPGSSRPYLIVSPSYTHKSSGVRTLHLLCHALNESGQKAYIVQDKDGGFALNPHLNTPVLTPQHWNYFQETQEFIAVYPDIIRGNNLNAKHVIRYLLAPRGAYGGDSIFPESDQIWGALPSIAENVLRIPVSDPKIFYPSQFVRQGSCFYSHKYEMHDNQLLEATRDSVRLEGSLENIADILRRSTVCYVYEVSSILTEAALCGCPVELIRTPYFDEIDPACMMGDVKWFGGAIVKECVDYGTEYDRFIENLPTELVNFIKKSQEMV